MDCDIHIDTTSTNPTQLAKKLQSYFGEKTNTTQIVLNSLVSNMGHLEIRILFSMYVSFRIHIGNRA